MPLLIFNFSRQEKIHGLLKQKWQGLSQKEKNVWRKWEAWDKLRYERDCIVYEQRQSQPNQNGDENNANGDTTVPKKRENPHNNDDDKAQQSSFHIPKKKRLAN